MAEQDQKFAPRYTVYRANKSFKGSASQLELSKNGLFWIFANQLETNNDAGNAQFDWKNKLTVAIGENDISSLLAFFTKPTEQELKLYHETPSGGNKMITLKYNKDNGSFAIFVSFKNGEIQNRVSHSLTFGESLIIRQLLLNALSKMFW